MAYRIETARAVGNREARTGFASRRFGAALAAFLLLAAPGVADAATRDAAARTGSVSAEFHDLFLSWQQADRPREQDAAIPSAFPLHDPVNFTSGFGVRTDPFRGRAAMHPGIDLAGPLGTPVYATADGIVDRSEWNDGGYGNLVEIDHGQGIQSLYGHLSERIAQPGQHVRRGDLIGLMGSTGRSTGSHLHYEIRIAGRAVDPIPFVPNGALLVAMRERRGDPAEGGPRSGMR